MLYIGLTRVSGGLSGAWRPVLRFLRQNRAYVLVIALFPLMVQGVSFAKSQFMGEEGISESISNGMRIHSLGGGTITVLQRGLDSHLAMAYMAFIYMWVFAFFTYFLPLLLIVKRDRRTLREFALAIGTNYAVLIPFYLFLPVAVSSSLPGVQVQPLLYSMPYWGTMATSVDSLTNCFPSGHTSLSFTALIIFALAGYEYRRLTYVLGVTALSVVVAVLYLGIHYPADVVGGLVLAVGASLFAKSNLSRTVADRLTGWWFRIPSDERARESRMVGE